MTGESSGGAHPMGEDAVAHLLTAGNAVDARVRAAIGARTQSIAEACLGLGVLSYTLGLVLASAGEDGTGLVPGVQRGMTGGLGSTLVLLVPFITAGLLDTAVQQRLGVAEARRPRHRFVVAAASLLPLLLVTAVVLFAPATPWPAALLLAVGSAVPLGVIAIRSALRARRGGIRRPVPALSAPLGTASRISTAALGIGLGAIGAFGGLSYPTAGAIVVVCFLFAVFVTERTQWGLPRLAAEWGRVQWAAFGSSYLLMVGLAVMLPRTTWDLNIVSIAGGIAVAAPLLIAAFRPAPIWER